MWIWCIEEQSFVFGSIKCIQEKTRRSMGRGDGARSSSITATAGSVGVVVVAASYWFLFHGDRYATCSGHPLVLLQVLPSHLFSQLVLQVVLDTVCITSMGYASYSFHCVPYARLVCAVGICCPTTTTQDVLKKPKQIIAIVAPTSKTMVQLPTGSLACLFVS